MMQNGPLFPQGNNEAKARPEHTLLAIADDPPIVNSPNDLSALYVRLLNHRFLSHRDTHLSLIGDPAKVACNLCLRVVDA